MSTPSIKCWTLDETLQDGVETRIFDSIVPIKDDTEEIRRASVHIVPTPLSSPVFFVREATADQSVSNEAAILAVNTAKWRLVDFTKTTMLDPSGKDGFVLLLLRNPGKHIRLYGADNVGHCAVVLNYAGPCIQRRRLASVMLSAVDPQSQALLV